MREELERLLRRVVDSNSDVDIPALSDRIIALVLAHTLAQPTFASVPHRTITEK